MVDGCGHPLECSIPYKAISRHNPRVAYMYFRLLWWCGVCGVVWGGVECVGWCGVVWSVWDGVGWCGVCGVVWSVWGGVEWVQG